MTKFLLNKTRIRCRADGLFYRIEDFGTFRISVGPFPTIDMALRPQ